MSLLKITVASLVTAGLLSVGGPANAVSSFGLAVLPDTQFYSRYSTPATGNQFMSRYGSEPYIAQTQWLAQHARSLGIPFVVHLGDIVDQVNQTAEWGVADTAMKVLEQAGVPYSILAGNHDVSNGCGYNGSQSDCTDAQRNPANEPYLRWFPTTRAQQNATFGGRDASGFHEYHVFEAQGQRFLVLALSWRVSDAGFEWARNVIRSNPTLPVIVTTHDNLAIESDGKTAKQTSYSELLWDRLIRDNDQIFMVINGHNHGAARATRVNDFGNKVEQFVVDYQMAYQGGNGYMRVYEFDLGANQIKALSFSPWVPLKPKNTLNQFDVAVLTDENNEFSVAMNFADRFRRFNPTFAAGPDNRDEPLVKSVREIVLADYDDIEPPVVAEPFDADDYARAPNTLAHWRFVGTPGAPVADGGRVEDLAGRNPLVRVPLERGALLEDAKWSDDHHALSAARGSVCFDANSNQGVRQSFFQTVQGAPLNDDMLRNGYTVEAIVKFSKDWTAASNQWMTVMSRFGTRGDLLGFLGGWKGSSTLQFAVSNLREFQWEPTIYTGGAAWVSCGSEGQTCSFPGTTQVRYGANGKFNTRTATGSVVCSNDVFGDPISGVGKSCAYLTQNTFNSKTNWSGEIMIDTWQHVAIVNDPVTHDTTMYVAGAPVLRNIQSADGVAGFAGTPWLIGGHATAGGSANGFLGCINEVRIAEGALTPDQWLTARKTRVSGTGGRQVITGTDGDDLIVGNAAADTITGKGGADTFVYRSLRDGVDTITDFVSGEDKLNLRGVLSSVGYTGGDALADGRVRVIDSAAGAVVQVDAGSGAFRNLVVLRGLSAAQVANAVNFSN
ncbi:LamG-like jellyroll fold domain-containing protein [Methyloversatilis thermotolerans]|uniref:LamG-like jellyroll fold domain-containing protein n=1 Tax=Methyloversatilis thermotolerans TaxID=1346290 RepID=UPI00036D4EB7|nr:LamG-like jellyroll fold domain-containing protein [Methyloversatilis thermotolerans]